MSRVKITDYVEDGGETFTLRVEGINAEVAVWISADGDHAEHWIGGKSVEYELDPDDPDVAALDEAWADFRSEQAAFGDALLREYEAHNLAEIRRIATLKALLTYQTTDEEN